MALVQRSSGARAEGGWAEGSGQKLQGSQIL